MIKMIAHIISSSVLIVAIWIVSFLMEKKMNPCIKYALWLLVVIKLLVPLPGFESDISVMNAVEKITPSQVSYLFVESEIEQDSVYDNHKYKTTKVQQQIRKPAFLTVVFQSTSWESGL